MGHKSEKHVNVDKDWVELLVNIIIGHPLAVLSIKYPGLPLKVLTMCYNEINKEYKRYKKVDRQRRIESPKGEDIHIDEFLAKAINICRDVIEVAAIDLLKYTLTHGIPKPSAIIRPGGRA